MGSSQTKLLHDHKNTQFGPLRPIADERVKNECGTDRARLFSGMDKRATFEWRIENYNDEKPQPID